MQFEGIDSRLRLQTDPGEREPCFVARVETELDLVAQPVARKGAHRLRRGNAEKHWCSVNQANGLVYDSPVGGSCGR